MVLWKQRLFARLMSPEGGEGGSGGGGGGGEGGGGGVQVTPELQAVIDAAVSTATAGLKSKNNELLGTLRTTKDNLARFDGIDPEAVTALLKRFGDDEEQALIKAGKIDEVMNKRTDRMKSDYDKKLGAKDQEVQQLQAKAAKLAAGKVSGALTAAASKSGALPEGMEDIVLRGQAQGWTVNDDGDVVALRDGEVVLGKDGKTPLTVAEWIDSLRESAPHLWPKAQGAEASGSGNAAKGGFDFSTLSPAARLTKARELGAK